jgi:ATP-dependent RNA helicase RhlE
VSFDSLQLHPDLVRGIKALGFEKPTPIQTTAIPAAMTGRDVLACAQTGSGKTAAFLLPLLHQLLADRRKGTTRVLILTPTRELAAQVCADMQDLARFAPIRAAAIFGGVAMGPQEQALRRGVDVVVATPGRLLDHLSRPYASLDRVEHLVLDEADRMLDMGFLPDIRRIIGMLPARKQTLLFSATIPYEITELAGRMLRDPVHIEMVRTGTPAEGVEQSVYPVEQHKKTALLLDLLQRGEMDDALVFTRTKRRADRLAKQLANGGIRVERIHGDRSQGQRTAALSGFKAGRIRVLVATDVASRGIDVEALGHVVNYDVPNSPEDYVHRVGRTGRAELTGSAFTFVSLQEEADLQNIEKLIRRQLPRVKVPGFDHGAVFWGRKGNGAASGNGHGHTPRNGNGASGGNGTANENGAGGRARSAEDGRRSNDRTVVAEDRFERSAFPPSRLGMRRGGRR